MFNLERKIVLLESDPAQDNMVHSLCGPQFFFSK